MKTETDKELLELAAKAVGIENGASPESKQFVNKETGFVWKPHLDDGDSRRLQVALKIDLVFDYFENKWEALFYDGAQSEYSEFESDPDPKRAVLLVAAAIGEKMP